MKKVILFVVALGSVTAFADSKVVCSVTDGQFKNSMLQAKEISLGSFSDDFSLVDANKLNVNVFGQDETFVRKSLSVTGSSFLRKGGTNMEYTLATNESVTAVVLVDRSPDEAYRARKFKGLVVITNANINLTNGGASLLAAQSLVYNILCKTN